MGKSFSGVSRDVFLWLQDILQGVFGRGDSERVLGINRPGNITSRLIEHGLDTKRQFLGEERNIYMHVSNSMVCKWIVFLRIPKGREGVEEKRGNESSS